MHKYLSRLLFFIGATTVVNLATFLYASPVNAITTIPKSKYEIIATFTNDNYMTQGGVVTKDYYVYTDCGRANAQDSSVMNKYGNTRHCTNRSYNLLHIVDRNTCVQKKTSFNFGYISGIALNDWNSNKITFGSSKKCMKISSSGATKVASCKVASRSVSTGGPTPQGLTAEYNGYLYKVSGVTNEPHPIAVVNKSTKKKTLYKLAEKIGEPEQISIDGNTGEVYLAYNEGHKCKIKTPKCKKIGKSKTIFIRIDASVFKKYTGKNKTTTTPTCKGFNKPVKNSHSGTPSSPSSSSSSSSSSGSSSSQKHEFSPAQSTYDGTVETGLFGKLQDDGKGCGIYMILTLIVDILTFGVGIAAAIGIGIAGTTYLTAKGNEQQAAKAKRRIYEIVIGIVAYVAIYASLNFLLPGGHWNSDATCKQAAIPSIIADSSEPRHRN